MSTTISLGQILFPKSKYKTFNEVKSGEYIYIYDKETQEIYFLKVDEVLDYEDYIKRDPDRYPEIIKNSNTIKVTNIYTTSYFWFKDKENPDKKTPEPGYYYGEKYAGQYISSSNFISKIQSFNWFLVGYDYMFPYRDLSWICTTPDEILHLINVDEYNLNKIHKAIIYNSIT